jgi:cell division protein FtsZ
VLADDVLRQAIQGISDLILVPGLINLDFADVKTIMSGMGVAMMGTGTAEGDGRAMQAAQRAIASPLLEDASVNGARGVIINVTGGPDMSLLEVNEASCVIQEAAHEEANIIFGAVVDPGLTGKVKITVIATGFDLRGAGRGASASTLQTPVDLTSYAPHAGREDAPAVAGSGSEMSNVRLSQPAVELPLTLNRRPALELALPQIELNPGTPSDRPEPTDFDLASPFDVPAFLRRQS